ncbi:DUF3990 domain-containing protein [Clostridium gasigenes]|uniref:DUF3990 domain-containing protein n=1 Tax=Clostridium gasigenes TaxID=94869 RepID=UPI001C0E15A1|nr:DUF3990 domain-containing protein [Clostridium gasigenes]MBU3105122.1 DUF3990 domain-containing protein [Clostridium gasigenes]MBU3135780.1 DUF3990 domain-containing protein [Clostridium gasigenes]
MLYHASGEVVEFPEIRKSRYTKDFSWGFYCTNNIDQAKKWAKRNREYPTHQISFHTLKALDCLNFERSEIVNE